MRTKTAVLVCAGLAGFLWGLDPGSARAADTLKESFTEGKFYADVRLRYEFVDQDGLKEANAATGRTRLGFQTDEYLHVRGVIEGEQVIYLANDNYNDTVNGKTNRAVVADPENLQVNQANLQFTGIPATTVKGGRQVIIHDGQRFIGDVGWRQNNQVFDAVMVTNASLPDTTLQYGYIYNVNRIFGEQSTSGDWGSNSHFYHAKYAGLPLGTLTTYGYFLDFGSDSPANSSRTFGGSAAGDHALNNDIVLKYQAEYAYQQDYGDNLTDYAAHYIHVSPAVVYAGTTFKIGYEILGSDDGKFAFRTPLATLHKWNGWADQFLTTPNTGLRDLYADISYTFTPREGQWAMINNLFVAVQLHDFDADEGSRDHGQEWGLYLKKPFNDNFTVDMKLAFFDADNTSTDTTKFILGLQFKY